MNQLYLDGKKINSNHGFVFTISGNIDTAGTNMSHELIVPFDCRIRGIVARVKNAGGTGSTDIILDVNKNGTTLYTDQTNRPKIYAITNKSFETTPNIVELAEDDLITIDIDQADAGTTPASDLVLIVKVRQYEV